MKTENIIELLNRINVEYPLRYTIKEATITVKAGTERGRHRRRLKKLIIHIECSIYEFLTLI
jgi:hypothetical protein